MNTRFEPALMDPWLWRPSYPHPEFLQGTSSFLSSPSRLNKISASHIQVQPFCSVNPIGVHHSEFHREFPIPKTVFKPKPLRLSNIPSVGIPTSFFQSNGSVDFRPYLQNLTDQIEINGPRNLIKSSGVQMLDFPCASAGDLSTSPMQVPSSLNVLHHLDSPEYKSKHLEIIFKEMLAKRLQFLYAHRISNSVFQNASKNGDRNIQDIDKQNISRQAVPSLTGISPISPWRGFDNNEGSQAVSGTLEKDRDSKLLEASQRSKDNPTSSYVHKLRNLALKNTRKHFLTPCSTVSASPVSRVTGFYPDCGASLQTQFLSKKQKLDPSLHQSKCVHGGLENEHSAKPYKSDIEKSDRSDNATSSPTKDSKEFSAAENIKTKSSTQNGTQGEANSKNKNLTLLGQSDHSSQQPPLGDRKTFRCPQCRYLTDRKNNLKRHIVTMHQASSKTLECCGVAFQSKAALRDHNAIFHRGGYRCKICSRNFCRKALLRRHLTVHSGQKDFFCDLCGYATSHKSNLERHQKVHNKRNDAEYTSKRGVALRRKTEYIDPMVFLRGLANETQKLELKRNLEASQTASVFRTDSKVLGVKSDLDVNQPSLLGVGYRTDKKGHGLFTHPLQETYADKSKENNFENENYFKCTYLYNTDINSKISKTDGEDDLSVKQINQESEISSLLEENNKLDLGTNNVDYVAALEECRLNNTDCANNKADDKNKNVNDEGQENKPHNLPTASNSFLSSNVVKESLVVANIMSSEDNGPCTMFAEIPMFTEVNTSKIINETPQQEVQQWQQAPENKINQVNTNSAQRFSNISESMNNIDNEKCHKETLYETSLKDISTTREINIHDNPVEIEIQDNCEDETKSLKSPLQGYNSTSTPHHSEDKSPTVGNAAPILTVSNSLTSDQGWLNEDVGHTSRKRMYIFTYACNDCLLQFTTQSSLASHDCKKATNQSGFGLPVVTAVKKGCEILAGENKDT